MHEKQGIACDMMHGFKWAKWTSGYKRSSLWDAPNARIPAGMPAPRPTLAPHPGCMPIRSCIRWYPLVPRSTTGYRLSSLWDGIHRTSILATQQTIVVETYIDVGGEDKGFRAFALRASRHVDPQRSCCVRSGCEP